jgi:YesN/AraC family two-component response regulator
MKLNQILLDLCGYTRTLVNDDHFGAATITFIEENYSNPNLDITMIAEHFSITSSYLSKKFKSRTGISLLDFINKTRVEQAKKALADSKTRISDIAEACGFINSNTFIRVFKKYEGVTPGRFREI